MKVASTIMGNREVTVKIQESKIGIQYPTIWIQLTDKREIIINPPIPPMEQDFTPTTNEMVSIEKFYEIIGKELYDIILEVVAKLGNRK